MTWAVVASALPLTATWPPAVMVHLLPTMSVMAAGVPAFTTVSFGDGVGAGVGVGVGVGPGVGVGVGVGAGVGVGVGVGGSGLTDVPARGPNAAAGEVLPHHRSALFS